MSQITDPQKRPVYVDLRSGRFLAEPVGAGPWPVVSLPVATTTTPGVVLLTDSVSSTSTTTAATPNSVKTAYDLASSANTLAGAANTLAGSANTLASNALPRAGGTMTGAITFAAGQTIGGYLALTGGTMTGAITFAAGQTIAGYGLLDGAQIWTKGQRGEITALTDAATITPDFADSNHFSVTLGGNRTLANPTNLTAGQSGCIFITQDGTGSRTLAYGNAWDFPGGSVPALSTAANAVDVLTYSVRTTGSIAAQLIKDIK